MTRSRMTRLTDSAIGLFSPRRAALRAHFRRMEESPEYGMAFVAMLGARGYRAAKRGKSSTPWLGGNRSADAELLHDLPAMRARSRELNRDDPIGSGLTGTFVRNIVGTGLRPQARTGDSKRNERIESVWRERKDTLFPADHLLQGEAQRLILGKVLEDGEVLVKQTKREPGEPVWFELVEADRLGNPFGQQTQSVPAGHEVRDGVEKDADGVPVAYWIAKGHPSDIITSQAAVRNAMTRERVLVDACLHLKLVKRPGQSRGEPIFHAILQDIHDLDLLLLASLKRVQIAACLAAFIKSPMPMNQVVDATAEKYGYKLDQDLEPGMIFKLYPDEELQTLLPNFPTPELEPFIIMLARRIGAALGVSWQVVLRDFSKSTYSSARSDLLETRQTYVGLQTWFIEKCLRWLWRAVMEDARLRGDTRLAGVADAELEAVRWYGDGWKWVDPLKEVQAVRLELILGITTLDEVWMELGKDPDEQWKKLEEQEKRLEAMGRPSLWQGPQSKATAPSAKPGNDRGRLLRLALQE